MRVCVMAHAVYHKVFSKEARVQIPKLAICVFFGGKCGSGIGFFPPVFRSYVVRVPPILLPILSIATSAV